MIDVEMCQKNRVDFIDIDMQLAQTRERAGTDVHKKTGLPFDQDEITARSPAGGRGPPVPRKRTSIADELATPESGRARR
jgi:hypothetical protein